MKCEICKKKIEETFLNKIIGAYFKDAKGKKHPVCQTCQQQYKNNKQKILEHI